MEPLAYVRMARDGDEEVIDWAEDCISGGKGELSIEECNDGLYPPKYFEVPVYIKIKERL